MVHSTAYHFILKLHPFLPLNIIDELLTKVVTFDGIGKRRAPFLQLQRAGVMEHYLSYGGRYVLAMVLRT